MAFVGDLLHLSCGLPADIILLSYIMGWVMEDGSVYGYLASKAKVRYTAYEMQRQYWPTGKKESGFFENFSETELGSSLTIRRTLKRL